MAQGAGELSLPMSNVMSRLKLTVTITGMRRFRLRMKLAGLFFRLGAWVAGCRIEIESRG